VGGGRIYLLSGRERGNLGRCPGDRSRFGFPAKIEAFSDDRDIGEADQGEHVSHDVGLPNSGYIPTLSIGFADRLVRGAVLICAQRKADDARRVRRLRIVNSRSAPSLVYLAVAVIFRVKPSA
jgi:hypothetical protein